ncbi:hypothetical protein GCM10027047_32170 [Rhodococcus aerolatus]
MSRRRGMTSLLGPGASVPRWMSTSLAAVAGLVLVVAALVATDALPAGTVVPGRVSDASAEAAAPTEVGAARASALPQATTTTPTPTAAAPATPRPGAAPQGSVVAGPQPIPASARPAPATVTVAALGVSSPVVTVQRDDRTGELVPPDSLRDVGWFAGGPAPGDRGPAVIAGHVDSVAGPAAFFALRDLVPGDDVVVARADGAAVRFRVTRVDQYDKGQFPSAAVYGPTPGPELRLITCGGVFDQAVRSYRDNIVVYAVAA